VVLKTFATWADPWKNASARSLCQVAGGPVCTALCVDITKLNNWIGVLDDEEMDTLDDALRLCHGLL
jgi:hypothetical protein